VTFAEGINGAMLPERDLCSASALFHLQLKFRMENVGDKQEIRECVNLARFLGITVLMGSYL